MKVDLVRALKDPEYRAGLKEADRPVHPAGLIELADDELARASGLMMYPQTTSLACTMSTWRKMGGCCPTG